MSYHIIYQMFKKTLTSRHEICHIISHIKCLRKHLLSDTKFHVNVPQRIQLLEQTVLPEGLKSFTLVPDFFLSFLPYLFLCRRLFVASFLHG